MKLKLFISAVSIVSIFYGCSNNLSTAELSPADSSIEHASISDVVIEKDSAEKVDFYPVYNQDSLPLKMLLNDVYSDEELLPLIREYNWWALETDSSETNFVLVNANMKLERTHEPMGDEKDSFWLQITNANISSAIFYVAGTTCPAATESNPINK